MLKLLRMRVALNLDPKRKSPRHPLLKPLLQDKSEYVALAARNARQKIYSVIDSLRHFGFKEQVIASC